MLAGIALTVSCATYHSSNIRHGAIYAPANRDTRSLNLSDMVLQVGAVGYMDINQRPTLRVTAAIDSIELFGNYRQKARLAVQVHVKGKKDTTTVDTLRLSRRAFRPSYTYGLRLPLPPGHYKVKVGLTDLARGVQTTRKARAAVPSSEAKGLGAVRMEVKDEGGWHPQAGYSLAGRPDSVRFTLHVAADSAKASLQVRARLLRFAADSSIARPSTNRPAFCYHKEAVKSLPVWRGIDYGDSTVLHTDRRTLPNGGSVQIRFRWKGPARGNYRLVVRTGGKMKARDFGVRSLGFPAAVTPRERAAPIAYLMDLNPYAKLLAIRDADSLAAAVADFWRTQVGDSVKARKVAAKYYRRVQEANRLFSNYKAGWKTDRGWFYILIGPPDEVSSSNDCCPLESDVVPCKDWRYDGPYGFIFSGFIQTRPQSSAFPFENFLITGNFPKHAHTQKQLWLSGDILRRKLAHSRYRK